jgi:hypothetical protein
MPKPIRELSLNGEPKPITTITRTCRNCGACFVRSHSKDGDGMTGVWTECGTWYCSRQCAPGDTGTKNGDNQ